MQSDRPRDQHRFARQLEKVVKATSLADDDDTWLQGAADIENAGLQKHPLHLALTVDHSKV
jgi:hypothetical protein